MATIIYHFPSFKNKMEVDTREATNQVLKKINPEGTKEEIIAQLEDMSKGFYLDNEEKTFISDGLKRAAKQLLAVFKFAQ